MSYVLVWLALMALLLLTAASSFVPMGEWNTVINFAVSCAKTVLIAAFFMELVHASLRLRLAAVVALFMLSLLFGLTSADYATRAPANAPWAVRPRVRPRTRRGPPG